MEIIKGYDCMPSSYKGGALGEVRIVLKKTDPVSVGDAVVFVEHCWRNSDGTPFNPSKRVRKCATHEADQAVLVEKIGESFSIGARNPQDFYYAYGKIVDVNFRAIKNG